MALRAAILFAATLLLLAPSAFGAGAKAGEPYLPPEPGFVLLASLTRYPDTIIALNRGRGGEELVRRGGGTLLSERLALWRLESSKAIGVVRDLGRLGALRYVEPDRRGGSFAALPGEPFIGDQGWLIAIGADLVTPPGPGVPLAILDSGLDPGHPEFANRPNTVFLNNPTFPPEEQAAFHGTAVSSVAAAPVNGVGMAGVYPAARLFEYDVDQLACSDIVQGIETVLANANGGPAVINGSFGVPYCQALNDEIQYAFGLGTVYVASAGNEFLKGNPITFPAALNHVLTVAATDALDEPAFFSNANLSVDLAAPGVGILAASFDQTGYFWEFVDGTSFSSPMVAAAAAWVWTIRAGLDVTQIFSVMRFSARDVWEKGWDDDTGFGVLDIPSALAFPTPPSDPQEPNEDIYLVKKNGLFADAVDPLTSPGHGSARLEATLDLTEDPADVYRAYIPGNRLLTIRLAPNADVDLDAYRSSARTVYGTRGRIAFSAKPGTRVEVLRIRNTGRKGLYIYVDAFLPKGGPLDAAYTLTLKTTR